MFLLLPHDMIRHAFLHWLSTCLTFHFISQLSRLNVTLETAPPPPFLNCMLRLFGDLQAWFRELPSGVLDSLTPEQVMHCNTEDDCTQLVKQLPLTEAALLDWAINLMTDVVEHEQYNKMNVRNIAMVFAPNMTQVC